MPSSALGELRKRGGEAEGSKGWAENGREFWMGGCSIIEVYELTLVRALFPVVSLSFVVRLHEVSTPRFSTFQVIDYFVCRAFHPLLAGASEAEAARIGRFLAELLATVHRWKVLWVKE